MARAQLDYLAARSEQEKVTVLVIPFGTGTFPNSGQGIVYLGGEISTLDTVQLDTDHGSEFLETQPQLAKYRTVLDRMEALALSPKASRDMIQRIAKTISE